MIVSRPWHNRRALILTLFCLLALLTPWAFGLIAQNRQSASHTLIRQKALASYLALPLAFEANHGQADPSVQFLSRGSGYSLFLTRREAVLSLQRQDSTSRAPGAQAAPAELDSLRMKLVGANDSVAVTGIDPGTGVVSYFFGNDPKKWRSAIPTFAKVRYSGIYPGVDLVFYGNQRQLEYDFVVAPGADPGRIAWQIDGATAGMDAEENLVLSTARGPAGFKKPVLYQMDGRKKVAVRGSFTVAGNQVRFQIGSYDHSKPLVIDPVLTYASYLGGSGTDNIGFWNGPGILGNNPSQGLAVDSEGSVYVTGYTTSTDFPTTKGAYQPSRPAKEGGSTSAESVFVSKFSPDGSSLVYSTYIGGSDWDSAYAIAVDSSGNAYVTGETNSNDFPITSGAYQTLCFPTPANPPNQPVSACSVTNESAFLTKLNSTGTGLVYSTFLGGYGGSYGTAVAVDSSDRAYVAGVEGVVCNPKSYTHPSCFPTTSGAVIDGTAPNGRSSEFSFVTVFDPNGAHLLYSTLFGDLDGLGSAADNGSGAALASGIAVDSSRYFYLVGFTQAAKLPTTTGVIQPTSGPDYPGSNAINGWRGMVAKFYPVAPDGGSSLAYATYLGGSTASTEDFISGITTDAEGNIYLVGNTNYGDFPITKGSYQTSCGSGGDCAGAFVTKLNPSGTDILWSTYVGGAKQDGSDGVHATGPIALDGNGNVYIEGSIEDGFPMLSPVEPSPIGGDPQVLIAELDPTGSKLLFSANMGAQGLDSVSPAGLAVDPSGNIYLAGNVNGPDLITTPEAFQTKSSDGPCCGQGNGFVARISAHGTAAAKLDVYPAQSQYGELVTLTATVSPVAKYASMPAGYLVFLDGSKTVFRVALNSTGIATYQSSGFFPGTHQFSVRYEGNRTYPAVASKVQKLTILKMGTATSLKISSNPAFGTQSVTFTATVAAAAGRRIPAGTLTFKDGTRVLDAVALNRSGAAVFSKSSMALGSHTITAIYSGSPGFATSASKPVTLKIDPKLVTTTNLAASAKSVVSGTSVKFTATVKSSLASVVPTGSVTFLDGNKPLGKATPNRAGVATLATSTLAVGSHSMIAIFAGDPKNQGSKSGALTVKVSAK